MIKVITSVIIIVFALLFVHSEFEVPDPDHPTHHQHDFCKLVDGRTNQIQRHTNVNLYKLLFIKGIDLHPIDNYLLADNTISSKSMEYDLDKIYSSSNIYLEIQVLLI